VSRLRGELSVAALVAVGFLGVFVLRSQGVNPLVVNCLLYATIFMATLAGGLLGLGLKKLTAWQSVLAASTAVLLLLVLRWAR